MNMSRTCAIALAMLLWSGATGSAITDTVRAISDKALNGSAGGELMVGYYESVLEWSNIPAKRIRPVPGKPDCAYYGEGGHEENDVRPIAYAALVNAFLSRVQPPAGVSSPSVERRARMKQDAVGALRYLVQAHKTGQGACVNKHQWGNQWQSAMWARSVGLAGWILWPSLDADLKLAVARLVEFEADRFLDLRPKSSEFKDTGAEENAWNAQILSLACNMMPTHPRAGRWAETAKLWMYNSLSVAADAQDKTAGDDGKPIREWVRTVNVHSDFTVENHGLVHIGYLKGSVGLLLENAVPYLLAESRPPRACLHHARDCFEVVLKCMGRDAAPIFFGGNDWKLFHSQNVDTMTYAFMSLLANDAHGAHLEPMGLDWTRRIQRIEGGYYNVRRDLEYGGACAARLIACYFAHAILGEGTQPVSAETLTKHITGVTRLEHGRAVLHRTATKFASFTWGPKRMALALPRNGSWVVWPHFASYIGQINGRDGSHPQAKLKTINVTTTTNSFTVTAELDRFDGALRQTFSYVSLPGDQTVYIERLTARPDFVVESRKTGIIGLEYELGSNERMLYGQHGATKTVGVGGREARIVELNTDWLNIDGRIGYVVRRLPKRANLMRYHDPTKGTGRVPQLQEWISLIGERDPSQWTREGDCACVVTFLNASPQQTKAEGERVEFRVNGNIATCRVAGSVVEVDFEKVQTRISGP